MEARKMDHVVERTGWSWTASITMFSIATVGEFAALAGWYLFHQAHHPISHSFYDADRVLVPWLRKPPGALAAAWQWMGSLLHVPHPLLAVAILAAGFIVERAMVVKWLKLPSLVFTPAGNLQSLELVIGGVTVAEIIVWLVWIALAKRGEPGFAALVLLAGIHVVHAYEVAVLKRCAFNTVVVNPEVMVITVLETVGGVWALSLALDGMVFYPLLVIFGALLIEHLLQVYGLTREAKAA